MSLTRMTKWALLLAPMAVAMMLKPEPAAAVPAFARQTGLECQACHVGSFGPQLTAYGRAFKLNGYVWGGNESYVDHFSGMTYGGYEHTKAKEPEPPTGPLARYSSNDNVSDDQASLFYAGRLTDTIGIMAQATYKDTTRSIAWDNTDVRYANNTDAFGSSLVYGVTLNNNPSVQDVWQSTPGWTFPYLASGLATGPDGTGTPQIFGAQSQRVVGLGAYGLWNDLVYAELSNYRSMGNGFQNAMGMMGSDSTDHLTGFNPYWRLALQHDYGDNYVALGGYGMNFTRYPGDSRANGTDKFKDYGLDATYQASLNGGEHIFSVYGTALREDMDLDSTYATGGSSNLHDRLTTYRANASYYFQNTYGLTLQRFTTIGKADANYYGQGSMQSQTGRPDSAGYVAQIDYTPTGLADAIGAPYLNARLFLQYTYYTKFNGASKNVDGNGTNAGDYNTLYTGVWFAF